MVFTDFCCRHKNLQAHSVGRAGVRFSLTPTMLAEKQPCLKSNVEIEFCAVFLYKYCLFSLLICHQFFSHFVTLKPQTLIDFGEILCAKTIQSTNIYLFIYFNNNVKREHPCVFCFLHPDTVGQKSS